MTKKTGGAAFPTKPGEETIGGEVIRYEGMNLRDWFAGQALAGALANSNDQFGEPPVKWAYACADAMLEARK
jgi:hypothetical protein